MTVDSMAFAAPAAEPATGSLSRKYRYVADSIPAAQWDATIAGFKDAHHEQTAFFAGNHWKSRDSHLMLYRGDEPIAGGRAAIIKAPGLNLGLAFMRFGPFWRRSGGQPDPSVYMAMLEALTDEYCRKRGMMLSILPRPHPEFHDMECEMLERAGFLQRRKPMDPERYLIKASLSEAEQLQSLDKKWRYTLKQANSQGLTMRVSDQPQDGKILHQLYVQMMERKKFSSTTPVHMTERLMSELPEKLRPRVFLAYKDDQPIVGATVAIFGDVAYNMFGATAKEALPLNGGYAMQWSILAWLREQGVEWYDLGGASHEPGLRHFKKGLVGKAGVIVNLRGEHDLWTHGASRMAADAIFYLRDLQRRLRHGDKYGH